MTTEKLDNDVVGNDAQKDIQIADKVPENQAGDANHAKHCKKNEESTKDEQDLKSDDNQERGRFRGRYRMNGRFGGRFRIHHEEEQRRWDEQQKLKAVIQQSVTGRVKWYSFRKNYGFIQRDDDQKDVFVHQLAIAKSRIRKPHLRTLGHGETVAFDVVQGKKGLEASNVTGPDGTEVQGCRIIFVFNNNYDRRPRSPYYSDFNRRPAYYNNYVQRPEYRDRDVRSREDLPAPRRPYQNDRDDSRRQYRNDRDGSRRQYRNDRDVSGYRGEKFDRQPYQRQRVYRGRRTAEQQKEENVEVKEATVVDNKNEGKGNKNGYRRQQRRQFRRGRFFKNQKNKDEGTTTVQAESSTKEASPETSVSVKPAEQNGKQQMPEEIIKGVGAIEVGN